MSWFTETSNAGAAQSRRFMTEQAAYAVRPARSRVRRPQTRRRPLAAGPVMELPADTMRLCLPKGSGITYASRPPAERYIGTSGRKQVHRCMSSIRRPPPPPSPGSQTRVASSPATLLRLSDERELHRAGVNLARRSSQAAMAGGRLATPCSPRPPRPDIRGYRSERRPLPGLLCAADPAHAPRSVCPAPSRRPGRARHAHRGA